MNKYALLIGIDDYPGEANDLHSCIRDIQEWRDLLLDCFGFKRSHVRMLGNRRANKSEVLNRLTWLKERAVSGDLVTIVYSGHGTSFTERDDLGFTDEKKDQALCLWGLSDGSNLLVDDDLNATLKGMASGVRISFVVDSCYSGGMDKIKGIKYLPPPSDLFHRNEPTAPFREFGLCVERVTKSGAKNKSANASRPSSLVLAACSDDEVAAANREDTHGLSVFSYYAIKSLREAAFKKVALSAESVMSETIADIKAAGHKQSPQLKGVEKWFDLPPFGEVQLVGSVSTSPSTSSQGDVAMSKLAVTIPQAKALASLFLSRSKGDTKALEDWQICEDAMEIVGVPSHTRESVCNDLFPHDKSGTSMDDDTLTTYEVAYEMAKGIRDRMKSTKDISDRQFCEDMLEIVGVPTHTRSSICEGFDD